MNAALYFELVDAVAHVDQPADLKVLADRILATPMHPIERRVLERTLRARTEALAIQELLTRPVSGLGSSSEPATVNGRG